VGLLQQRDSNLVQCFFKASANIHSHFGYGKTFFQKKH